MTINGNIVVSAGDVGKLEGQLLTAVESLGLNDLQDNGAKGVVRNILWSWHDLMYNSSLPERDDEMQTGQKAKDLADAHI